MIYYLIVINTFITIYNTGKEINMFYNKKPDRVERNSSDGQTFYGYDDKSSGTTDWYDKNGCLDSTSETPSDED